MRPSRPLRLGVVPYLNALPILHGLEGGPAFTFFRDTPARVADRLHRGEIDLGLIPSVEYALGDYAIVPGIAIGSRGPVRSVTLFHRLPLEDLRRVAVDVSSRTSVALLKILLRQRLGRDPEYTKMAPSLPEMLAAADAALVIGDPALDAEAEVPRLDLGEEWTARTGLPFVWAFWAGRPGAASPEVVARLQEALRSGLRSLAAIALSYNGRGPGRAAEHEAYLRSNIMYEFGAAQREGLEEFYRRAHAASLIPRVPELRFDGRP